MPDYDTMKPVDQIPGQLFGLSDDDQRLLARLHSQLQKKEPRNKLRSNYYDGKNRLKNLGISIPPSIAGDIETVVGWPAQAVDKLEQRLNRQGFTIPTGDAGVLEDLENIYDLNNMQTESSSAHVSALTHGTAFAFGTRGNESEGEPPVVISIRSARQATAIYNRRKRALDAALEIVADEDTNADQYLIIHKPDEIITARKGQREWVIEDRAKGIGIVSCVPFIHRPFVERVFGMSRVTRPVMSMTDTAVRTVLRTEVSAEFYSAPQRYLLGADESAFQDKDGNVRTGWEAILGRLWAIPHPEPDEDQVGEVKPITAGQFPQQSMVPHTEHLRSTALMFAGETGIPVSSLGIIHDNPSSADAIRAGEMDLVAIAERDQLTFGNAHANLGKLIMYMLDGNMNRRDDLAGLRTRWLNAATPTQQAQAQAAAVLIGQGTLLPRSPITYEYLGFDDTTIRRLQSEDRRMEAAMALERLTAALAGGQQGQGGGTNGQSTQNQLTAVRPDVPDTQNGRVNGATR